MQGIFQKENTDKALKYGIYRHLPTYEKIIRNLVSFYVKKSAVIFNSSVTNHGKNGTNCKKTPSPDRITFQPEMVPSLSTFFC